MHIFLPMKNVVLQTSKVIQWLHCIYHIHCHDCSSIHQGNAKQLDRSWWNLEKKNTLTNCWLQIWWLQRFDIKSPFHVITSSGTSHAPSSCLFCQHLRIMDSLCLWMEELERLSTFDARPLSVFKTILWKKWKYKLLTDIIFLTIRKTVLLMILW